MNPLFDAAEPASPPAVPSGKPGVWCEEGPHWLTDPVSIKFKRGPQCRKNRGIVVPSQRRITRLARVRGWVPGPEQTDLLEQTQQDQELSEGEHR